ncbi:MAG: sugar ABC transporter ATP-binding protein [Bacilli bacterium]
MSEEKYILKMEGVSKSFGKNKVLKDVSMFVRPATIMGLMGENGAGKSTMMKCLFGIYSMDSGEITLDGQPINFSGPKDALEHGVAMVHQELNQCLERTIVDNLFLGRYPTNFGIVDERTMTTKAQELFKSLDMYFNPKTLMRTMSVSQRQMVEIAKAVSYDSKVIVLDEPTSSLSEREVKKLFKIIRKLRKEKDISFIYISHKMDEITDICDDIMVLRDGQVSLSKPVKDTNLNDIVKAMVGRSLENRFPELTNTPGEVVLKVNSLSTKYEPVMKNIAFEARRGEILGIYGLVGSGRSELLEALFGARTVAECDIDYLGKKIFFKSPKEAMNNNFAFITEERKVNGMFAKGDLLFNTSITNLDKYKKFGIISNDLINLATKRQVKAMNVKCNNVDDLISSLSGGNQQKVIVGKWLERNPDIFLMDEPTRGIDILAKYQIYELMIKLANEGKTIIMVSSEMPEILGVTNRIIVMSNYKIAGEIATKDADEETLLKMCAKYL